MEGDPVGRMLALHERYPERYPVLLDSSAVGMPLGRFTLLLAGPEGRLLLDRDRRLQGEGEGDRFCDRLDAWWRRERGVAPPAPWPFAGGWFLFLGYELASEVEPSLRLPPSPLPVVALAWRMRAALLHDHESGGSVVLAEPAAASIADRLRSDLQDIGRAATPALVGPVTVVSEDDPERYLEACRAALAHIAAGDVYRKSVV